MAEGFVDVAAADEVPDRDPLAVDAHGYRVALFRLGDGFGALWSRCPHAGGPLDEGYVNGEVVACPWHGAMFRISDGECLGGPSAEDAVAFPVEVADGRVLVGPPPEGTEPPPPSLLDL